MPNTSSFAELTHIDSGGYSQLTANQLEALTSEWITRWEYLLAQNTVDKELQGVLLHISCDIISHYNRLNLSIPDRLLRILRRETKHQKRSLLRLVSRCASGRGG